MASRIHSSLSHLLILFILIITGACNEETANNAGANTNANNTNTTSGSGSPAAPSPNAGGLPPSAVCGNGSQESGEACDGNTATGTCSSDCLTFTQAANSAPPPAASCGNGIQTIGERCDDGNTRDGDGCSSVCQTEQSTQASPEMTFFVTSRGGANGGNYGGLEGADEHCRDLAKAARAPDKDWKAYLSTWDPEETKRVNARDRIGRGPWYDFIGKEIADNVDRLHENPISPARMLTETGETVRAEESAILTGTDFKGNATEFTCENWTSSDRTPRVQLGHTNPRSGAYWNSYIDAGCSADQLSSLSSSGRLYCFAVD